MVLVFAHYYPTYYKDSNGRYVGWWSGLQNSYYTSQRIGRRNKFIDIPLIGMYDVREPEVLKWQIRTAYSYGIDGFIVSVFENYYQIAYDVLNLFDTIFAEAGIYNEFLMFAMVEAVNTASTFPQSVVDRVWSDYANRDWYLLDPETGKPVLFVYGSESVVTSNPGFEIYYLNYGNLKPSTGNAFTYGVRNIISDRSVVYGGGIMEIVFRMPMRTANTYAEATRILPKRFNIKRIERALASISLLNPKLVNIVSWNEWFETAIEPGVLYGYLWLNILAKYIGRRYITDNTSKTNSTTGSISIS